MKTKTKIALFTLSFPYGNSENFLETEIKYLAKSFDEVIVFPSSLANNELRDVPSNVEVNTRLADLEVSIVRVFFNQFHWFVSVYFSSLFSKEWKSYLKYFKSFFHYLALDLVKLQVLENTIKKEKLQDAVFYDYWFVNSTISLSILRKEKVINKVICRVHRFDLYDEIQFEGKVSFRNFKIRNLDFIYAISNEGRRYLETKIKQKYLCKLKISYLGVRVNRTIVKIGERLLIVSCSSLLKRKRVLLLFKILNSLNIPLKWVHFGDGVLFENLKEEIKKSTLNIEVDLKGQKRNEEIHEYYQKNRVDFFISLSTNEGLPVSMMEAQGYGIPIVAMDINGIPEIVNEDTGVLIPESTTQQEIVEIVKETIEKKTFDYDTIIEHFETNFSAENNYTNFSEGLLKKKL